MECEENLRRGKSRLEDTSDYEEAGTRLATSSQQQTLKLIVQNLHYDMYDAYRAAVHDNSLVKMISYCDTTFTRMKGGQCVCTYRSAHNDRLS